MYSSHNFCTHQNQPPASKTEGRRFEPCRPCYSFSLYIVHFLQHLHHTRGPRRSGPSIKCPHKSHVVEIDGVGTRKPSARTLRVHDRGWLESRFRRHVRINYGWRLSRGTLGAGWTLARSNMPPYCSVPIGVPRWSRAATRPCRQSCAVGCSHLARIASGGVRSKGSSRLRTPTGRLDQMAWAPHIQ